MRLEVLLVVHSDEVPQVLLDEIVSNLESVNATVETGCILLDGIEMAIYDRKERHEGQDNG